MRKLKKKKAIQIAKRYLFYCTLNYAFFISDAGQTAHYGIEPKKLSRRELAGIMHGFVNESYGTTAQFVGSAGDAFSAICCLQIFRFTSSKPSKSAIASDEKFIRLRTNSFVRYCPCNPPPASFAQHIGQGAAVYAEVTTPSIIRASGEGDFLQKAPLPRNLLASSPP